MVSLHTNETLSKTVSYSQQKFSDVVLDTFDVYNLVVAKYLLLLPVMVNSIPAFAVV